MKLNGQIEMTSGPLGGKILKYALLLAATGILQQLFNAADIAVVGRYCGTNAQAAVGANGPVCTLRCLWLWQADFCCSRSARFSQER